MYLKSIVASIDLTIWGSGWGSVWGVDFSCDGLPLGHCGVTRGGRGGGTAKLIWVRNQPSPQFNSGPFRDKIMNP